MQTLREPQRSAGHAVSASSPEVAEETGAVRTATVAVLALASSMVACGGGGGGGGAPSTAPAGANEELLQNLSGLPGSGGSAPPVPAAPTSRKDAVRFLTQATFGARSVAEIDDVRAKGYRTIRSVHDSNTNRSITVPWEMGCNGSLVYRIVTRKLPNRIDFIAARLRQRPPPQTDSPVRKDLPMVEQAGERNCV